MTITIKAPGLEGQTFEARLIIGGVQQPTVTITDYGVMPEPPQSIVASAGKMNVLPFALASAEQGLLSPRDDGGTSLNLLDLDPAVTAFSATTEDGDTVQVEVLPKRQLKGWGTGRHWMMPIDKATGKLIFRRGRKGRKLYVTKRPRTDPSGKGGYTKQDIATETGLPLATITDTWIMNSTVYGRTADKPLEMNTGFSVWGNLTNNQGHTANLFASHWLLLERGHDYRDGVWGNNRGFISRAASGESPLHPMLITAYGTGNPPRLPHVGATFQNAEYLTWIAFQDVDFDKIDTISGFDKIISNANVLKLGCYIQNAGHNTLWRVSIPEATYDVPTEGLDYWDPMKNRKSGIYASGQTSLLFLECYVDQAGWRTGYSPTSLLFADGPQPPSMYSHNLYLNYAGKDTTIRRMITSRAASMGIQCRTSGLFEDIFFLDNNIGGNQLGRSGNDTVGGDVANAGNFALINDCVMTSAGWRTASSQIGGINWGFQASGYDGVVNRLIAMHVSDPNNPTEIAAKGNGALGNWVVEVDASRGYLLDLYAHRWDARQDNAAARGVSTAVLNNTTVQKFIPTRGGSNTTIEQYCLWLRTLSHADRMAELDAALQYFRTPWGLHVPKRVNATTCVFVPSPKCSGVAWADRLNWSTQDTAGSVTGDSAELRGASVRFGELTVDMVTVDGQGGSLEVSSGLLKTGSLRNFTEVKGIISGQLFPGAVTNIGKFVWESGLLVFPATAAGHDLTVNGQYPEVVLGPNHTIADGKVMDICCGAQGAVGWTGTGTASLTIASGGTLRMRAYAGAYGARMSKLERFVYDGDHADPTVAVTLTLAAGSVVEVDATGLAAGTYDLTGPGITVVNNGATLPAGVTITSGKLVLTVS